VLAAPQPRLRASIVPCTSTLCARYPSREEHCASPLHAPSNREGEKRNSRNQAIRMHISPGVSAVAALAGLSAVLVWRVQEGRTAVTVRKILIPPVGMATGFFMFFVPAFRVPWTWAGIAFLIGALALAYPLLLTSRLERIGDTIMMKRSGAFFAVVIVLAAIRYFARGYFDRILTLEQTGALFFILAFGMILRWRVSMFFEYRKLAAQIAIAR
jgi:membrane protein CcdC involved in cytochrome C biogenesis